LLNRPRAILAIVESARKQEDHDAALILLYTLLDILASLSRPNGQLETTSDDFMRWVEEYLLPGNPLTCSAEDLWGFRCGMLHTLSEESSHTRKGKSRIVLHIDGAFEDERGLRFDELMHRAVLEVPGVSRVPPNQIVFVHVGALATSIKRAIARFMMDINLDKALEELVSERVKGGRLTATIEYAQPVD